MKSFAILTFAVIAVVTFARGAPAAPSADRQVLPLVPAPAHLPAQPLPSPFSALELIAQLKKTLSEISTALNKANSRLEALIPQNPVLQQVQAIITQLESDSNHVILKAIGQLGNAGSLEELVHIAQLAALEIKQLMFVAMGKIQQIILDGGDIGDLLGQIQDIYSDLYSDLRSAIQPLLDLIGGNRVAGTPIIPSSRRKMSLRD